MNHHASSFAILEPQNNIGYGREDFPCGRDGQIKDLILDLTANVSFEQVMQLVPHDADSVVSAFAERSASLAVRHRDERELRAGCTPPRSHWRSQLMREKYYPPWPSSTARRR
jgi:hypothetical protein